MMIKPKKQPMHGWLNLWKPRGMSSMQALGALKRLYHPLKIGHAGTLDPEAEGILPIAFGEATKLIPLLHDALKAYRFTVRWGVQTNTDDVEGETIATSDHRPAADAIRAALPGFTGTIQQTPPAFSAVKINGVRAYAAARAGEEVILTPRPVFIDSFILLETPDSDTAIFQIVCGTGTYVRALARDLALTLGTVAHCTAIIRNFVGPFHENYAISLENLGEMDYTNRTATLWPMAKALDDIPAVAVTTAEAQQLHRGQQIRFLSKMDEGRLPEPGPNGLIMAVLGEQLIALGTREGAALQPTRVFNT